jgi:hypothetical protein
MPQKDAPAHSAVTPAVTPIRIMCVMGKYVSIDLTQSGDASVMFPSLRVLHAGDAFDLKGFPPIIDANNGGSGVDYDAKLSKAVRLPNIDTVISPAASQSRPRSVAADQERKNSDREGGVWTCVP